MKKRILTQSIRLSIAIAAVLSAAAYAGEHERSKPNYVGGGRYTCHDKTAGCAIIKDNNRRITQEKIERSDSGRKHYTPLSERSESALKPTRGNEGYGSRDRPTTR